MFFGRRVYRGLPCPCRNAGLPGILGRPGSRLRNFGSCPFFGSASSVHFDARTIDRAISADYPVNAINFLRRQGFEGPLYNNLNWGGFLMWYLPELPVAVDGRNDLYGDAMDKVFYESQSAFPSYTSDPYLDESRLVILDSTLPLAKILTIDKRFQMAYHDDIATVFTRR